MIASLLVAVLLAIVLEYAFLRSGLGRNAGWGRGVVVYLLPRVLTVLAVPLLGILAVYGIIGFVTLVAMISRRRSTAPASRWVVA